MVNWIQIGMGMVVGAASFGIAYELWDVPSWQGIVVIPIVFGFIAITFPIMYEVSQAGSRSGAKLARQHLSKRSKGK